MAITGFADFESKLDSVNRESGNFTDALASNKTFANKKQIHQIVSFSLVFVDTNGKLLYEKAYSQLGNKRPVGNKRPGWY